MCDVCFRTPCSGRCPNAPEPEGVATCSRCENPIFVGEEYAIFDEKCYCEQCLIDMPYSEIVTLFGGQWKIAQEVSYD